MKKIIALSVITAIIMGSVLAYAGGACRSGYGKAGPEKSQPGMHKSVRYRRMMRELDREYQEGSLTRTEYIQRKREIKALCK